ncbi:hypothetical protein F5B18DRAFT_666099 [Nemania serpens]|nr:hypothetical protein F5B18DRAFT_666099 [Nemania serpens]
MNLQPGWTHARTLSFKKMRGLPADETGPISCYPQPARWSNVCESGGVSRSGYSIVGGGVNIDVLLCLIDNRVAGTETTSRGQPWLTSASAIWKSQKALTDDERLALRQAFHENGVIYRPPSFKEGGIAWIVGTATVVSWWDHRQKFLSPDDCEGSNKQPMYEVAPGAVDSPEDENDDSDDSDVVELSPPTSMEMSDVSDSELAELKAA